MYQLLEHGEGTQAPSISPTGTLVPPNQLTLLLHIKSLTVQGSGLPRHDNVESLMKRFPVLPVESALHATLESVQSHRQSKLQQPLLLSVDPPTAYRTFRCV